MSDIFRDYSFGGWLREFRVKRELTLREAATQLEMDAGNYSKLERSELPPPKRAKRVLHIANTLKLSPAEYEMLASTAYNYHLAKFREEWEVES